MAEASERTVSPDGKIKCYICKSQRHLAFDCPVYTYVRTNETVMRMQQRNVNIHQELQRLRGEVVQLRETIREKEEELELARRKLKAFRL